jgi:hypothetical protein
MQARFHQGFAKKEHDRKANGYYADCDEHLFELPGVWFSAAEPYGLLATDKLRADLQPGLFKEALAPLRTRIGEIQVAGKAGQVADLGRIPSSLWRHAERRNDASRLFSPDRLVVDVLAFKLATPYHCDHYIWSLEDVDEDFGSGVQGQVPEGDG